jgi:hypothetical protein
MSVALPQIANESSNTGAPVRVLLSAIDGGLTMAGIRSLAATARRQGAACSGPSILPT